MNIADSPTRAQAQGCISALPSRGSMQGYCIGAMSQAYGSRLNTVSCSLGPACWLWDFLRRSKQVGCFFSMCSPSWCGSLGWVNDIFLWGSVCELARGRMDEACFETDGLWSCREMEEFPHLLMCAHHRTAKAAWDPEQHLLSFREPLSTTCHLPTPGRVLSPAFL